MSNRYALQVNQLLLVKCGTFIPISLVEPLQLTPSQHEFLQCFESAENNPYNCPHEKSLIEMLHRIVNYLNRYEINCPQCETFSTQLSVIVSHAISLNK